MYYPNITYLYIVQLLSMPDCCSATLSFTSSSSSEGECLPGSKNFEMFLYKTLIFYFRRIVIILLLCEHFTEGLVSSNKQENAQDLPVKIIPAWEFKNPVCLLHKPLLPEAAGRISNLLEGFRYQSLSQSKCKLTL